MCQQRHRDFKATLSRCSPNSFRAPCWSQTWWCFTLLRAIKNEEQSSWSHLINDPAERVYCVFSFSGNQMARARYESLSPVTWSVKSEDWQEALVPRPMWKRTTLRPGNGRSIVFIPASFACKYAMNCCQLRTWEPSDRLQIHACCSNLACGMKR